MITSLPDTVDDGIGSMPRALDQEFVTLPEYYLRRTCDPAISRLNALLNGTLQDYLTLCSERWLSFAETMRRAHQIFQDLGRFEGFPDRATRDRKVEQIVQALQELDQAIHALVGRAHGLQRQSVRYIRMTGDGILFQLTTIPLSPSFGRFA